MKAWTQRAAMLGLLALSGAAQAALVVRGGGMIYDTTLNITWLADLNYAKTSGYAANGVAPGTEFNTNTIWTDGRMGWDAANSWANNLVYGGFDDWRLPTLNSDDTTCSQNKTPSGYAPQYYGFNCTGSELSHLLVADLGSKGGERVLTTAGDTAEQIANLQLFSNLQAIGFWSSQEYSPDSSEAWAFDTHHSSQFSFLRAAAFYAVAVRPGDVTAAVPEPQTWALSLLALGAAVAVRRRRAA